ncbi:MAG: hypothetical protein V3U84_03780 [Thiotrichaceae bacterium]
MADTTALFSLGIGDRFVLSNEEYTITNFRNRRVPRLGKTLCCETLCKGKVQCFLRNWQVLALKD